MAFNSPFFLLFFLPENVMAGGDSAARGLVLGGLLGTRHGAEAWPSDWIKSLERKNDIEVAVSKLAVR